MSDDRDKRLTPTVMPIPARPAAADRVQPKASATMGAAPVVLQPTAIAGTERQRLQVDAAELDRLSPGTAPAVVERALALLHAFVLEKASERRAILWQQDLQKTYSAAVGTTLTLSQLPLLSRMQGHVARMLIILRSFDFAAAAETGGAISRALKRFNDRIDTVEEIADACAELERLKALLGEAMEPLLKLKEDIENAIRTETALSCDIEAAALAALYLSGHYRALRPGLSERFLERSMSLTQTLAQIKSNRTLRSLQAEHPLRLVTAIQTVTLVSMPAFLVSLTAANAVYARKGSINPTEASELQHKLQDVIQLLNA